MNKSIFFLSYFFHINLALISDLNQVLNDINSILDQLTDKSIAVLPQEINKSLNCYGVCTDFVTRWI